MGSTKVLLQSLRKKYSQQVFPGQTKARNEKFWRNENFYWNPQRQSFEYDGKWSNRKSGDCDT